MSGDRYKGVVADLVDPYFTIEVKNTGGFRPTSEGGNYAIWWLRRNPGRWAMVGEGTTGLTKQLLRACPDIEVKEKSYHGVTRIYACLPHPEGESFREAFNRRPPQAGLYLPELTRDEFGWTKAELEDACRAARANLYPTGAP